MVFGDQLYQDILIPLWTSLCNEHICPLLAIHIEGSFLPTIEVPHYARGNIVEHNRHHPEANKLSQITQIAAAVRYLHDKGVCHRNLCPSNVLVKDDGQICVSDTSLNYLMRQLTDDTYTSTPATWRYKPPEELLDAAFADHKADIYSWASVAYEVCSGKRPYHGCHYGRGVANIIRDGHRAFSRPLDISPELWCVIQKCWKFDPEERPDMHQVESELRGL